MVIMKAEQQPTAPDGRRQCGWMDVNGHHHGAAYYNVYGHGRRGLASAARGRGGTLCLCYKYIVSLFRTFAR